MSIVYNADVAGLIRRARRYRKETYHSVSAGVSDVTSHDIARQVTFLGSLTGYADWVVSQPELDLPETAPSPIDIGSRESFGMPENEAMVDLIYLYEALEDELADSQSARRASGLHAQDERRFRDVIAKMESFLTNYVAVVQPLDLPESSPMREMTGPGNVGV